jgi:glutamine amidotransferase
MIGLIDYGAGNMQSVANALTHLDVPFRVCDGRGGLAGVDRILLPGVGHFGSAARHLCATGLMSAIREHALAGTPVIGICLGLHLLYGNSEEAPDAPGLDLLPGRVARLQASRVPHMGWNRVTCTASTRITDAGATAHYYFAHGYVAADTRPDQVAGTTEIDSTAVPAIVGENNVWGVQFHPEKSGADGLALLRRLATC